jgi:hypothetical protein
MNSVIDSVLDEYLKTYRDLTAVERLDNSSIILSVPLHLAARHRIEVTVTDWGKGRCLISDSARTLGEIEAAGYSLTPVMMDRLEKLAGAAGVRIVDMHLVLESAYNNLGSSIQKFIETSKTIGDVYLVHRHRAEEREDLVSQVRTVLNSENILYRPKQKLQGQREAHSIDLFVMPNGRAGLALNVLGGQNTHALAQIWYCKCDDIRLAYENRNIRLALIYDVRHEAWTAASKAYLEAKSDVVLPGDLLGELPERLKAQGIIKSRKASAKSKRSRLLV